jgi:hypothetical protein
VADRPVAAPPTSDSTAAQLRRRREAALRLPPLESGYRDPLDAMTKRDARLWICDHPTEPLVLVSGEPRDTVRAVLDAAGVLDIARWSDLDEGWVIPADHAEDVQQAAAAGQVLCRRRRTRERQHEKEGDD